MTFIACVAIFQTSTSIESITMGCDIDFFVEVRRNGAWRTADVWDQDRCIVKRAYAFYKERNYALFAMLANVRNDYGVSPFSEPRGVPDDACPEIRRAAEYGGYHHDASHFTVAELMRQDWEAPVNYDGYVPLAEYIKWDRWGRNNHDSPNSYAVWTNHTNITEREVAGLIARIGTEAAEGMSEYGTNSVYVKCSWEVPCYRAARSFTGETMPRLWKLGKPEDVRCVFWFVS